MLLLQCFLYLFKMSTATTRLNFINNSYSSHYKTKYGRHTSTQELYPFNQDGLSLASTAHARTHARVGDSIDASRNATIAGPDLAEEEAADVPQWSSERVILWLQSCGLGNLSGIAWIYILLLFLSLYAQHFIFPSLLSVRIPTWHG